MPSILGHFHWLRYNPDQLLQHSQIWVGNVLEHSANINENFALIFNDARAFFLNLELPLANVVIPSRLNHTMIEVNVLIYSISFRTAFVVFENLFGANICPRPGRISLPRVCICMPRIIN